MRLLPDKISVTSDRLLALLELAGFGCRSAAERLLVESMNKQLDDLSSEMASRMMGANDAADQQRPGDGATGTQSTGAGGCDGGGARAES